jgi:hypothetical protein
MSTRTRSTARSVGSAKPAVGEVIDACAIDLPPGDVVESIEFERFFRLDARIEDLQRPLTIMSAWISMSTLSTAQIAAVAPQLLTGAPLSAKREDWFVSEPADRVETTAAPETTPSASAENDVPSGEAPPLEVITQPQAAVARFAAVVTEYNLGGGTLPDISTAPLAFYLPYAQEWKLRGYTRGRIVNSITLGPQEEQTIEIFKWDRLSRTLDSTTSYEFEQTNESSGSRRDTTDISREIARQAGFELTSNAKVGFKVDVVNADFSGGTNAKTGLNNAEKEARREIVEATTRAATNVRSSRTLKVVETKEAGEETRVTRKLRNRNNCHSLTNTFFEILANYDVTTSLRTDAIKLVVLLESSDLANIRSFDRRKIRSHERALTLALLDSTLAPGFEAARFLEARDRACAILCGGCDCGVDTGLGMKEPEWDALQKALVALGSAIADLRGYRVIFPASVATGIFGPASPARKDIQRHTFLKALATHAPRLLSDLGGLGLTAGAVTPALADQAMTVITAIATEHLDALATPEKSIQDAVWFEIFGAAFFLGGAGDPITAAINATVLTFFLVSKIGGLAYDDGGLVAAIADVRAKYTTWQGALAERRQQQEKLAELERIAKEERSVAVLNAFPLRASAEAEERLEALLDHLNDERNIDHYRFAVWNERAGSTDPKLLALALAGLTEGAPVGVVGDNLAVPVKIPPGTALESFFAESIKDVTAMSPSDTDHHILPSAALYAEAAVGECSACEHTLLRQGELDLQRREIENGLLELEAERRKGRIGKKDFGAETTTEPIRVELTTAPATGEQPSPKS